MHRVTWSCACAMLLAGAAPAVAADGFAHHVTGVALPPKAEQAGDPLLADFYLDVGRAGGALPGAQYWVYRIASLAGGREVSIPVARLEVFHVEERVSIARVAALTLPENDAFVEYRTVMLGDPVERIVGTGLPPLGERDLPAETFDVSPALLPPLRPEDRAVRTFYVPNVVLFDFDKSTLRPEGKEILKQITAYVRETNGRTVRIEGHTCSIGSLAYNQGLSGRRSAATKQYFAEVLGLPAARIVDVGYGETRPVASNATEPGRERNRRSEITVDGRRPGRTVPDGLAVPPEALLPEAPPPAPRAGLPVVEQPPAPTSAPVDLGPPLPELARPRS